MIKSAIRFLFAFYYRARRLFALPEQVMEAKILSARILVNQIRMAGELENIRLAEFKVFSQFGDDGIIQYLIHHARINADEEYFIEFGVESYQESNTRFLLVNNNWRGLVIDGDPAHIRQIRNDNIYWRYDLTAVSAFIDADNIDALISSAGYARDIGLLSIDIDGNDYWVWSRIECVKPVIVVVEYNSSFGCEHAVSVPYDPAFRRVRAHFSNLYWGCSIKALELLAKKKGYALVGSNSAGNNLFFVRTDRLSGLKALTAGQAYVRSSFRDSRNRQGELTFLSGPEQLKAIREMPLHRVDRGDTVLIADLYNC